MPFETSNCVLSRRGGRAVGPFGPLEWSAVQRGSSLVPLTMQIDRAPRRGCAPCENSRYCRRASAGSWPYLPFAISSCVFLPCRTTAAARRSPLMPTGPPGAIRSRRVWRGLPGSSTQTFGVRLRTFTFARLTLLCNFLRSTTAAALESENGGRQLSRYAQSATRR